ncbi:unannotated protein [freshwater metagenome]|uniref:Unannotated protein n=1 Tax=freshwater metagenome TaxID=449393 RepID=A0A6J7N5I8_9ZZZZ
MIAAISKAEVASAIGIGLNEEVTTSNSEFFTSIKCVSTCSADAVVAR